MMERLGMRQLGGGDTPGSYSETATAAIRR